MNTTITTDMTLHGAAVEVTFEYDPEQFWPVDRVEVVKIVAGGVDITDLFFSHTNREGEDAIDEAVCRYYEAMLADIKADIEAGI